MTDTRLIERWLPIAELGEESTRERRSMTAFPAHEPPARLVGTKAAGCRAGGGSRFSSACGCRSGEVSACTWNSWGSRRGSQCN